MAWKNDDGGAEKMARKIHLLKLKLICTKKTPHSPSSSLLVIFIQRKFLIFRGVDKTTKKQQDGRNQEEDASNEA